MSKKRKGDEEEEEKGKEKRIMGVGLLNSSLGLSFLPFFHDVLPGKLSP